jgi:hypothetical protein
MERMHTSNLSTLEAETGLQTLHKETLSQNKNNVKQNSYGCAMYEVKYNIMLYL